MGLGRTAGTGGYAGINGVTGDGDVDELGEGGLGKRQAFGLVGTAHPVSSRARPTLNAATILRGRREGVLQSDGISLNQRVKIHCFAHRPR